MKRLSSAKNLRVITPVGYWGFLILEKNSSFLLTDSGGIQEECTAPNIRRKCFILRTSTKRQDAVDTGFAELVGVKPKKVLAAIKEWWECGAKVPKRKSRFGNGKAAKRSVKRMKEAGYC